MEVSDSCGKPIIKGSYVVYAGTGTIGKVVEIRTEDEGLWAKIDATDLWYNSRYLQIIDNIEGKELELKSKDIKEKIKERKKLVGEDIDMSSELCDGGG